MKIKMLNKRNATASYAFLQIMNWSLFAVILGFSSNLLRHRGFTDGQISVFLGATTALTFFAQLALGELISRVKKVKSWGVLVALGGILTSACLVMALPDISNVVAVGSFGLACLTLQLLPALTNGIAMDAIKRGSPTNYSLARGMGSLGYSAGAYATGMLVREFTVTSIPVAGAVCGALFIVAVVWYHFAGESGLAEENKETLKQEAQGNFLKKYPRFAFFLIGTIFVQIGHCLPSNFMYQIIFEKNGTAEHQGIATAICALAELPVMFGFPWLLRKLRCDRWVRIGALCMILKNAVIFLADGPGGVYLAQATQMLGYGLYIVSVVNYAELVVDKGESIRAQSYMGAVSTVGSLIASSTGGVICQYFGVQTMVLFAVISATIGGVMIAVLAQKTEK